MRREILFRAKKETDGKWVEGLPNYCSDNGSITKCETYGPHSSGVYTVDPDTICQYTGLTDKNGHKIFEEECTVHTDTGCIQELSNITETGSRLM